MSLHRHTTEDHRGQDHDHDHHHDEHVGGVRHSHAQAAVDQAMEDSREGVRALKISLLGLGATGILQLVLVFVTGSVALLSDTLHNFADALTALPLWLAFVVGRRRPTRRFTYGYGRAEDLAGLVVVLVIAGSGMLAIWQALSKLRQPEPLRHLGVVMAAALIGMVGNWWRSTASGWAGASDRRPWWPTACTPAPTGSPLSPSSWAPSVWGWDGTGPTLPPAF